jgi:transposase
MTHESDARMMRTHKRPLVACNLQTAVDAVRCLIPRHEFTQDIEEYKQLEPMAKDTKEHLQQGELTVICKTCSNLPSL